MPTANLSVVLCNFNHARYLPRALDALLAQTVRPREVIVLDDASTDDSLQVLEHYARRDPDFRLYRNDTNRGVVASYNRGAELAVGESLLLTAADDYTLSTFLEKAAVQLEANPQAGLCFAYDSYSHGADGAIEANPSGWSDEAGYFPPDAVCQLLRHCIPGHAVVCRRAPFLKAGGFLADMAWYSDWFAFLTVAFRHGVCHLPETLSVRVLLPGSYSTEAKERTKNVAVLGAFLKRMLSPEYSDVAPYFQRNGAATYFGTDLIRAAARRSDRWDISILKFLNGYSPQQYESLLDDPDPSVRELALFFLGPFWRQAAEQRAGQQAELDQLKDELALTQRSVPPPGAAGKIRWLGGLVKKRIVHRRSG